MAFKLIKVFKGIPANYWRIISITEDLNSNKTTVKLGLYSSALIRKENVQNILDSKTCVLLGVDLTRAQIYADLKKLDLFKNAVDC